MARRQQISLRPNLSRLVSRTAYLSRQSLIFLFSHSRSRARVKPQPPFPATKKKKELACRLLRQTPQMLFFLITVDPPLTDTWSLSLPHTQTLHLFFRQTSLCGPLSAHFWPQGYPLLGLRLSSRIFPIKQVITRGSSHFFKIEKSFILEISSAIVKMFGK